MISDSIYLLLTSAAGDFHLQYIPDITSVFQFSRPGGDLVSLSTDGIALPQIYFESDLPKDSNGKFTASPIVKINNQTASDALTDLSDGTKYHDADARYNTVFTNPAQNAMDGDGSGLSYTHYKYIGPSTTYTFANGSQKVIENVAFIPAVFDFTKVTDGPSFFKRFCTGPPDTSNTKRQTTPSPSRSAVPSASRSATSTVRASSVVAATSRPAGTPVASPSPAPGLVGYPTPVFVQGSKRVSGYYLDQTYADTAVLVLPGFDPSSLVNKTDSSTAGFVESQTLIRTFLANSVKAGKKKLVVDLRGNGGGTIDFGFELFKQLFPKIEPYGGARYRAHDAFHYYSALTADIAVEGKKDGKFSTDFDDADYGIESTFLWSNILTKDLQKYKSYKDYYGPQTINGDTFTSIRRYNFSNNLGGHTLQASLTGYNEFRNTPNQPFDADNIVIIQDGFCGSTCAIFSELMREQGKVQTIVIGGRPRNGPMQGVGGSKGSQKLGLDTLADFAERTIKTAEILDGTAVAQQLNKTAVGKIYNAEQIYVRTTVPAKGAHLVGAVNSLNNLRMNDTTDTPLEFIYEAADCRLFYTVQSYLDPVVLWKQAIDAKWASGKCVAGSTGDKTAIGVLEKKPFANGKSESGGSGSILEVKVSAGASAGVSSVVSMLVVGFAGLLLVL